VAIVAVQFPGAEENLQNTQDVARSLGVDVVDVIEVAPTQTTFSSTVEQLRDSDPDMVLISNGPPQSTTLVQSAAQLGYTPKWGYFAAPNNERDFKTIAQNAGSGALWMVSALPPASAGDQFPGISKYNAEMDNAADNNIDNADADNRNENSIDAWLQIHALAEVAATITGPVTSESMLAALKTTTDLDVEGLVTWSPGGEGTSRYPKLSDDMALYVGPVEDGVYAPESDEPVRVLDIAGTATGG
jgi:ABC-type branched-subunit amino acid transport system substrate-binding protein